jgi:hypothetical protein
MSFYKTNLFLIKGTDRSVFCPEKGSTTMITESSSETMMCCDTGSPTTVSGVTQAKEACQKLNVPYVLQKSLRSFRSGDNRRESLGILRIPIPTPIGIRELSVDDVDLDIPILLGLDSFDALKAYLNTFANTLEGINWNLPC